MTWVFVFCICRCSQVFLFLALDVFGWKLNSYIFLFPSSEPLMRHPSVHSLEWFGIVKRQRTNDWRSFDGRNLMICYEISDFYSWPYEVRAWIIVFLEAFLWCCSWVCSLTAHPKHKCVFAIELFHNVRQRDFSFLSRAPQHGDSCCEKPIVF